MKTSAIYNLRTTIASAMNSKKIRMLLGVLIVAVMWGQGVMATNYYSAGNTDAKTLASWWTNTNGSGTNPGDFTTPGNFFIIQDGHTMSTSAGWAVTGAGSTIQINSGGTLVATFGVTATVMTVSGTYQHNINGGTIPTATWEVGSLCKVTGSTGTTDISGMAQSFYDFTYDCSGGVEILASSSFTVTNNFTLPSTNTGTVIIGNGSTSYVVTINNFLLSGGNFYLFGTGSTVGQTLTIEGNYTQDGGNLDIARVSSKTGTVNVAGNFTHTGGTITKTAGTAAIYFNGTTGQQTIESTGQTGGVSFSVGASGAQGVISAGKTFVLGTSGSISVGAGAMSVFGTYEHRANGGSLPSATWNSGSLCKVTGNGDVTSIAQTFYNFTYDNTAVSPILEEISTSSFAVTNDFTMPSTNTATLAISNGTVAGSFTVSIKNFILQGGNFYLAGAQATATQTLTVTGNYTQSGGTLDISRPTGTGYNGTVNVAGNFTHTAGTITETGSSTGSKIIFNGVGAQQTIESTGLTNTSLVFELSGTSSNKAIVAAGKTFLSNKAFTVSSGNTLEIASTGNFTAAATLTNNGTTTVNGTFQLNPSGYAAGTNFVYGPSGTLAFNNTASYGVNPTDVYWPTTNGPVNITILQGGLTLGSSGRADRTVTGTFQTAAAVTLSNSSVLTINGICQINTNGSFNLAPTYGNASTLIYNSGSNFAAGQEWYPNNSGSVPGVPQNVTIASGTSLYFNGTNKYRLLRGDLTFGTPFPATSTLALSGTSGGDLYVGGNWNKTAGGLFAANDRLVKFNGSNNQTITSSGGETFAYLEVNNSSGVTLANDITVNNTLDLTSGLITTGSNTLTIGSSGSISGASESRYVSGKLARVITGTSAIAFPVGKGGNYRPVAFTYTAAPTSKTVTIEQFESGSPLSLASVSTAHSGSRYWNITQSATGIGYTVGLNNTGFSPTGTVVMLRREGTGTTTSNATSFSTPTYTNTSTFSTADVSNDVQLGETAIPLTVTSAVATSKIYDKTNTAEITGTLSGVVSPDVVTLNGTGTFASVNIGTGLSVTSTSTLAGANAGAYSLTQPTGLTANITARPLTITGAANTKTFDGNTSSTTVPTVTSGVIQSGDVAAFTQVYDNANVGSSKVMTPSGIVTDGNSGNNYSYSFVTSSNGTINAATSTTWDGSASSNWNTPDNWTPPVAPTTGISAVVVTASNAPVISSTANECNALTITSGSLTVENTGQLTVGGAFINSAAASALVVKSGGSLITNSTVSGSITVEREIAEDNKWHFLSSPVTGQNICDGDFAPLLANFNQTNGETYDFYSWKEPTVTGNYNWRNIKGDSWALNTEDFGATPQFISGKGYLVAYNTTYAGNSAKSFAGTPASGDRTITLSYGGTTWNLVGNPFPSAINWDGVDKTGLNSGYYQIYNEAKAGGAGYEYYLDATHKSDGTFGEISVAQGFFVVASGTSFTIPNSARVHNNNWLKHSETAVSNRLELKLASNTNFDQAYILFESGATGESDFYDASKMRSMDNSVPQVYSLTTNNQSVAFNSMPMEIRSVKLGTIIPSDGNYTLNAAGIETFSPGTIITLEDLKDHTTQVLTQNPVYSFNGLKDEANERFILHFGGAFSIDDQKSNPYTVYSNGGTISITGGNNLPLNGDVLVYNLLGQLLTSQKFNGSSSVKIALDVPTGYYIVKVVMDKAIQTSKVFMN